MRALSGPTRSSWIPTTRISLLYAIICSRYIEIKLEYMQVKNLATTWNILSYSEDDLNDRWVTEWEWSDECPEYVQVKNLATTWNIFSYSEDDLNDRWVTEWEWSDECPEYMQVKNLATTWNILSCGKDDLNDWDELVSEWVRMIWRVSRQQRSVTSGASGWVRE